MVACTPEAKTASHTTTINASTMPLRFTLNRTTGKRIARKTTATTRAPSMDLLGVIKRNHRHRPEIVRDGQSREKNLEPERYSLAEDGQHPEGEGDIGGHGNSPAPGAIAAEVEHDKQQRRRDHATEGRRHRQARLLKRRKFADHQLALDLEADDKEEDHHQPVVDPVVEGELEDGVAPADTRYRCGADRRRHRPTASWPTPARSRCTRAGGCCR